MNANSAREQDETFKERTYGTGRRILVPPGVSTRNQSVFVFRIISCYDGRGGPSGSPFCVAKCTSEVSPGNCVWLKRRRQQRQQKERHRLWCREWLGPLRRRQFCLDDQLMVELRREDPRYSQELFANATRYGGCQRHRAMNVNERSQLTTNDPVTTDLRMDRITTAQWTNRFVR